MVTSDSAATRKHLRSIEDQLLRIQLTDCTLHPVVWLLLSGLLGLAWILQPEKYDSPVALSSLLFLRFVPIFIVVGSLWGRAGSGAVVGMGLFFGMMGAESLSLTMWDVQLPRPSPRLVPHANWLGNTLFLVGLLGLLGCGGATLALRWDKQSRSRRYLRRCLQIMAIVQVALVVELTFTSWWIAAGVDS